jgi:hypothetical protein
MQWITFIMAELINMGNGEFPFIMKTDSIWLMIRP